MPSAFTSLPTKARGYVVLVVCLGLLTIGHSLYALTRQQIGWGWTLLAVLTLVSGSATLKLPSLPATISVSETFVFTSVLLFGPAAGTLTVALDALVISLWGHRRKRQPTYKSLFNVAALALTLWASAQVFFLASGMPPLVLTPEGEEVKLGIIVFPLLAFAVTYYALNSAVIAYAISLERRLSPFKIWRENFVWISLNYFGGASVAAVLVSYTKDVDFTYVALIIPLLLVMYFTFSTSMGRVDDANRHLAQLNSLYMSTIETLAMAIDAKDQITHGHIRRVQTYAVGLARRVGVMDPQLIQAIEAAALLHDMGKLAVPEYILNKPGPLSPAEFEKMKLHASVGADILSAIDFPYPVVPIVRHHHENWNGTGYPDGLAGTDIPMGARILSVVDCFDALTSDRPYRPRLSDKDAIQILVERRGTMYDPLVVDTFINVHQDIAPPSTLEVEPAPLRAITDAAGPPTVRTSPEHGFEDISGSTEEMLTLFSLARGLSSLNSLQDVGDIISKHLRRLIPSSLSVLYSYETDSDELVAIHAAGENAGLVAGMRIGTGQRLSGWVAANKRTIRNSDPVLDLGETARAMNPRPRSCLSTPLVSAGNLVGVLTLYATARDAFSEEHHRVIEVVARQVTPAVQQSAEIQRTRIKLLRDTVTGLPKLEHFRDIASTQVSEATSNRPVSLIVVSINPFLDGNEKQRAEVLSDDKVSALVRLTRQSLRAADMLFQYGTSRFVALLLHTDESTGSAIAKRITQAVSRSVGIGGHLPELADRIHISVATAPDHGSSIEDLLRLCLGNRLIESELPEHPGPWPPSIH